MKRWGRIRHPLVLVDQLAWFVRLRWGAGGAVIAFALADAGLLHWYGRWPWMLAVGGAILAYNALFRRTAPPPHGPHRQETLLRLAGAQVALDLLCLTALTVWTGGAGSPLLGFYVFHMVFASLLLPRSVAYGMSLAAMAGLLAGLALTRQLPADRLHLTVLAGWGMTLLATVYLANHITRGLHRHQWRIQRQADRIRAMAGRLRRQQQVMVQQEKAAAIGQLAAGVAHEISNPLACIDSMLLLLQRRGGPLQPDEIPQMREQVARITQTVQQLVHFAHPGHGERQVLPVNQVVTRALQMLRFDIRLRKVELVLQPAGPELTVRVQPRAMEQVLINLVLNALDAVSQVDKPRLEIRTRRDGPRCLIDVIDNGHGIQAEHLPHVFEPFFTTKPVGKGTGLGLAISANIVRSIGGQLEAASRPGKGATFTIALPLVNPEPAAAGPDDSHS